MWVTELKPVWECGELVKIVASDVSNLSDEVCGSSEIDMSASSVILGLVLNKGLGVDILWLPMKEPRGENANNGRWTSSALGTAILRPGVS